MSTRPIKAISLFSGGLDSLLASRLVMSLGIEVTALTFVTPFFGYGLLAREQERKIEVKEKYGINLTLVDITDKYLTMLRNPAHGYGKNFNPCVDCKILLISEAGRMMEKMGASFLITGEVIGQRPMSQRRDTLRTIERDSGCEGILLRPLCARNLPPTRPEEEGLIDRQQLLNFSGRSRKPQMKLAQQFGITEYPSPAGGCILTDPVLAERIRVYYDEHEIVKAEDILLLKVGRQFRLPGGGIMALGRHHDENQQLERLILTDDLVLKMTNRPGPTAILRNSSADEDVRLAAALVVRYGKKPPAGETVGAEVTVTSGKESYSLTAEPIEGTPFQR